MCHNKSPCSDSKYKGNERSEECECAISREQQRCAPADELVALGNRVRQGSAPVGNVPVVAARTLLLLRLGVAATLAARRPARGRQQRPRHLAGGRRRADAEPRSELGGGGSGSGDGVAGRRERDLHSRNVSLGGSSRDRRRSGDEGGVLRRRAAETRGCNRELLGSQWTALGRWRRGRVPCGGGRRGGCRAPLRLGRRGGGGGRVGRRSCAGPRARRLGQRRGALTDVPWGLGGEACAVRRRPLGAPGAAGGAAVAGRGGGGRVRRRQAGRSGGGAPANGASWGDWRREVQLSLLCVHHSRGGREVSGGSSVSGRSGGGCERVLEVRPPGLALGGSRRRQQHHRCALLQQLLRRRRGALQQHGGQRPAPPDRVRLGIRGLIVVSVQERVVSRQGRLHVRKERARRPRVSLRGGGARFRRGDARVGVGGEGPGLVRDHLEVPGEGLHQGPRCRLDGGDAGADGGDDGGRVRRRPRAQRAARGAARLGERERQLRGRRRAVCDRCCAQAAADAGEQAVRRERLLRRSPNWRHAADRRRH